MYTKEIVTCIHDVPMNESCEQCESGVQGRLEKLGVCYKCEELKEEVNRLTTLCNDYENGQEN